MRPSVVPWMNSPTCVRSVPRRVDGVEHALATAASGVVDALRKRICCVALVELHRVDERAADVDGDLGAVAATPR